MCRNKKKNIYSISRWSPLPRKWGVSIQLVSLEEKHPSNKTCPFPCFLLAFTLSLVTAYSLGLFGSAVLATSPHTFSPISSPVAFGGRLKRQPWCCTCTAQHQLKHWYVINTPLELQSTAPWVLLRKGPLLRQHQYSSSMHLMLRRTQVSLGNENKDQKACTQCRTEMPLWFHPCLSVQVHFLRRSKECT